MLPSVGDGPPRGSVATSQLARLDGLDHPQVVHLTKGELPAAMFGAGFLAADFRHVAHTPAARCGCAGARHLDDAGIERDALFLESSKGSSKCSRIDAGPHFAHRCSIENAEG